MGRVIGKVAPSRAAAYNYSALRCHNWTHCPSLSGSLDCQARHCISKLKRNFDYVWQYLSINWHLESRRFTQVNLGYGNTVSEKKERGSPWLTAKWQSQWIQNSDLSTPSSAGSIQTRMMSSWNMNRHRWNNSMSYCTWHICVGGELQWSWI